MSSKKLDEHSSIAFSRPPTSLCTLPDELLEDIFSALPSTYILPPINRQLLPFHQSQRFRNVVLTFRNFDTFFRIVELNEPLQQYTATLVLDFSASSNRNQKNLSPPRRRFINSLLASLNNLEDLVIKVDYEFDNRFCLTRKDFSRNPRLQSLAVQSSLKGCDEILEGTAAFEFEALRYVEADDLIGEMDNGEMSEAWMHGIVLEVKRLDEAGNHRVRYYTNLTLDYNFVDWCKVSPPITQFESVTLAGASSLLERLFYDTLRQLPLESLRIGPQAKVTAQHIIDLVSKPKLASLRTLVLDNLDSDTPEILSAPGDLFIVPVWTEGCSQEGVTELRELTKKLGVEAKGTTFDGLALCETEGFDEAVARMLYRESLEELLEGDTDGDEDDEWESDRESEDEARSDFDEAEYLGLGHLRDEHDAECGCGQDFFTCTEQLFREIEEGE